MHKDLWTHISKDNRSLMGLKALKSFWKLASLFWQKLNRKNIGETQRKKPTFSNPSLTRKYQPSGISS
jgi:hypothetical protein